MSRTIVKADLIKLSQKQSTTWDKWEPLFRFTVFVGALIIIIFAFKEKILFSWQVNTITEKANIFFKYILFTSGLIFVSSLAFRTYLWFKYKPYGSTKITDWPKITVIIPAYNEGKTIYETVLSVVNCSYPKRKMKIITVDDGSNDDTYLYMKRIKTQFPRQINLIRFPKNKGKRQALYEAYKKYKSPYIITVDSDTILEKNAIKEILSPLIINKKIGAVTGRIKVINNRANVFTRMLNAHFAMAFDFTRAIQSTYASVFCLSGAFSAFKSSVLNRVINRWVKQKFLNKSCTYGEDRSLTNHILRTGFGTFFQRSAISYTIVPEKLKNILKMLTRWARSNIRESIIFSSIMWNSKRKGNRILPFVEFFSTNSLMILHFILFYYFLFSGFINGHFLFRVLSYSVLFGFLYMLYYFRIEGKGDFPYILVFSIFSSIFMIWIFTAAGFTLTKQSWSTR